MITGAYCKGSYLLGTACGNCERCVEEKKKYDAMDDLDDPILGSLPEMKFFRKCRRCGSSDWGAANCAKEDDRIISNCDKCPWWEKLLDRYLRRNGYTRPGPQSGEPKNLP